MMSKNLIGERFGKLTVLRKTENPNNNKRQIYWVCKCDCGNETNPISTSDLNSGRRISCNVCSAKKVGELRRKPNLIGQKYGYLTIKEVLYNYNNTKRTYYRCTCDCGKTNIIKGTDLLKSTTASCGCKRRISYLQHYSMIKDKDMISNKYGRLTVQEILWENQPVKVKCLCDCGKICFVAKSDLKCGHTRSCGCLQVDRVGEKSIKDFSGLKSEYGIEIIKRHKRNKKNVFLWECKCFCGNIFYEVPARILNGHIRSCGCLKSSTGEKVIESFLRENNVRFKAQYSFPDLKYKYRLKFDFAILNDDNTVKCLIEYDGEQHFKPVELFGGAEQFEENKIRDNLKNEYCLNNNLLLLRFPYTMDISEIKEKIYTYIKNA